MSDRNLILGIDTSSEGDLALVELGPDHKPRLLASQQFSGRHQAAELIPKLTLLFTIANASMKNVHAIVIVNGPGSFTGLRIGLSAAKGLAEAADIPVIAISSLQLLAGSSVKETVAVMLAGRDEYYVRFVSSETGESVESLEDEASLHQITRNKSVIVASATLREKLPAAASITVGNTGAYQAILAALPRFHAGAFDDVATLDANYVRRPYTEMAAAAKPAR